MNEWAYINMRGSKYGLVKILGDGALEKYRHMLSL